MVLRAAALAEVEPSIAVALGARRRAEDMAMVGPDQLRSEEMGIDGMSMVGWGDEKAFRELLVVQSRKKLSGKGS